ncbi:MAG: M48 family metallopeptidase [Pseudolabrys sp.]|nr:M48 family metallopeptidase [Pseudolabrys sp.]
MELTGLPNRSDCATPATGRRGFVRALGFVAAATAALLVGPLAPAQAQNRGLPVIRDTEIESLLRDYATPVLRAAGLAKQNVRVVVLNDRAFNAFVMDGRHIFINAGALFDAKTPNEIIGVFAHETGHLAGGHLQRLREQLSRAQTASIIGLLLGAGAAVAGGANAGAAAIMAPQAAIQRSLLAYVRTQEDQADHAGVKFLTATHQSARGMLELFKRLSNESLFNSRYVDPYLQTHPMPAERIAALEQVAKTSPYFDAKDPPALQARHDMMRAKLAGFLDRPETVARRYPASDSSLPARYARAIVAYRRADIRNAIAQIDGLIQTQPGNPYFQELKGQALLEAGRASEAIGPLRHAARLSNSAPLIQVMLAQALINSSGKQGAEEAVGLLNSALAREPNIPEAYDQLAMAYGRQGDLGRADLAAAQAALNRGDLMTARQIAARAKGRLPVGSPPWVQANDITDKPQPANARN